MEHIQSMMCQLSSMHGGIHEKAATPLIISIHVWCLKEAYIHPIFLSFDSNPYVSWYFELEKCGIIQNYRKPDAQFQSPQREQIT